MKVLRIYIFIYNRKVGHQYMVYIGYVYMARPQSVQAIFNKCSTNRWLNTIQLKPVKLTHIPKKISRC